MGNLYKGKYRKDSDRAEWWDYNSDAIYFITICTDRMVNFFGKIVERKLEYSAIGELACRNIESIPKHFEYSLVHEYIVMPDHIHLIMEINKDSEDRKHLFLNNRSIQELRTPVFRQPKSALGSIIRSYKSSVTRVAMTFDKTFSWQRGYNDRVVRSQKEFDRIKEYIKTNLERHYSK